jgi:peptide/nickel transport system ATP-binding protein
MSAALEVCDLRLSIDGVQLLNGVNLSAQAGQITAVVGASGCGKSLTLLACVGLEPASAIVSGEVLVDGTQVIEATQKQLQELRGARVGLVFQEVMAALNPVRTIGDQIAEAVYIHRGGTWAAAAHLARAALDRVGLSAIEAARYPHQLSGGQRQRVAIAIATVLKPAVLLADEPTSALDVTTQAEVMRLFQELVTQDGIALVLVSHDLALVAAYADHIYFMEAGAIVAKGTLPINAALHPSVQRLMRDALAEPKRAARTPPTDDLLVVKNLCVTYRDGQAFGRRQPQTVLKDISFCIRRGESVGLVGESGSGKSTLARAVLGLQPVQSGTVQVFGQAFDTATGASLKALRRHVQIVFQDPFGSFDPRLRIDRIVAEPLYLAAPRLTRAEERRRVDAMLERVGLSASDGDRYPHAFSGGQRQRLALARALIIEPALIVLDEAVSALDVSTRARILDLLAEVAEQTGVSYLFISHDIAVVRAITDRTLVLRNGEIVEEGETAAVFAAPRHAYTRLLVQSTPILPAAS